MILDQNKPNIDSQLIVTLAKQALNNLHIFQQGKFGYGQYRDFADEFCTVKISLPRQSGHSTAALQLMYEYPGSLLFVPSGIVAGNMRHLLNAYTDDAEVLVRIDANIMVPGSTALDKIRPVTDRPFIILDQVSIMREDWIKAIKGSLQSKIILELQ